MSGETIQFGQVAEQAKSDAEKRQMSTIAFPYLDQDVAVCLSSEHLAQIAALISGARASSWG